ncbi:MAG TPA: flotillin domain-containing protein, partial [Candidatus Dormibacteraeota bacterium]
GYQAEVDQASAVSKQAGPLSEATARQKVVVEETRVAELEAERTEKQLLVDVRKPADARAYEQVTLAKASREAHIHEAEARAREIEVQATADAARVKLSAAAAAERVKLEGDAEAHATQARGHADGEALRARGMAEAEAIKARAEALAGHQDAIIGQQLAEKWPEIVEAAAKPFGDIDQLIVLNGAQGISDALAQALSQGVAGLQLARRLLVDPAAPAVQGTTSGTANGRDAVLKKEVERA